MNTFLFLGKNKTLWSHWSPYVNKTLMWMESITKPWKHLQTVICCTILSCSLGQQCTPLKSIRTEWTEVPWRSSKRSTHPCAGPSRQSSSPHLTDINFPPNWPSLHTDALKYSLLMNIHTQSLTNSQPWTHTNTRRQSSD